MKSADVYFHSIAEVKEFVNIVSGMEGKVTLSDERHSVDARSIIGIFCLNLTRELRLEIENWEEKYGPSLAKYVVRYHPLSI